MQYALLAYAQDDRDTTGPMDPTVAQVLDRPAISGWARLYGDGSATTVRSGEAGVTFTDGPFVETKEYLAGVILVEADDLDGALAVARELQEPRGGGAIEVRPVLGARFRGA